MPKRPAGEKWQRSGHHAPTLEDVWVGRRFPEDLQPPELLDAAYAYTVDAQEHADGQIDGSLAWHGWAVRKAFICGAVWERIRAMEKGQMSVRDAGRKGGQKTSDTHGRQHFERMGSLGGQRVRELVARGKAVEEKEKCPKSET